MANAARLRALLRRCPLIAILRGIGGDETPAVAEAIVAAGITNLEITINSPMAIDGIRRLVRRFGDDVLIGGGTVLTTADADAVATVGGQFIVSPNTNTEVIRRTKTLKLLSLPGAATPTEALRAVDAGADGIKMFPAEMLPPAVVKAWRAVLSPTLPLLPVGGIHAGNIPAYRAAGADGFGVGASLYKPGMTPQQMKTAAAVLVAACQ